MKRANPLLSAGAALLALCLLLTFGAYQLGATQRTNTPQNQPEVMAGNAAASELSASAQDETNAPTLTLIGNAEVTTDAYTPFTDPGCTAQDAQGNDLTGSITTDGTVSTNTPGDYTIHYQVTDAAGNTASAERVVHVKAAEVPTDKVIYLTFDDGPSAYTQQLLDVLEKYNVKVTLLHHPCLSRL